MQSRLSVEFKGWSRAKKEAYIRGDYAALVALAKRSAKRALRDG